MTAAWKPVEAALLPVVAATATGLALLSAGCDKDAGPKAPLTFDALIKKVVGPSPKELADMAFDPADPDRRRQGILGLARHDWGLKEPYLKGYAAILRTDRDPLVRAAAARALGKARDPAYLDDVAAALADPEAAVRQDAAVALDSLVGPSAVQPLRKAASGDEDVDVRAWSARAMRHYNQREVLETLVHCLGDPSFTVRYQAHESLVAMTGRDMGYEPEGWTDRTGAPLAVEGRAGRRPWWDWMGVTRKRAQGSPSPSGDSRAAGQGSRPWWDWMGVTRRQGPASSQPATRPQGT